MNLLSILDEMHKATSKEKMSQEFMDLFHEAMESERISRECSDRVEPLGEPREIDFFKIAWQIYTVALNRGRKERKDFRGRPFISEEDTRFDNFWKMKNAYAQKLSREKTHELVGTVDFSSQVAYAMYLAGVDHGKKNLDIGKELVFSRLNYPTEPLLNDYQHIVVAREELSDTEVKAKLERYFGIKDGSKP
ncbi:hypothetical protein [Lactococcus lactis]|uniref:Uncharacterized protein n=2 Tax=Lactococcus lactis TaxID=1358 RepID=A0AAE4SZR6_9LACT|nr:hypothetical protein [Lactococcus lactis]KST99263.1 hypothetical protein KF196_1079 [Lactococcus lactis subsp. lactis]KSU03664.1 hypothetical protein KF282_1747 [Lactococcus lactis subsp. lactis]MDV2632451.1 hypothetical protein [Lactococcus lactis]